MVIALALLACIAFALSVQGGRWWVISDTEIGPFGAKRCFEDGCQPTGLSWLGIGDRGMRIGMGAWAAGLITALALVVMAAGLAAKRIPKLAAKTVGVSTAMAAITGSLFAIQFRSSELPLEYGRGFLLFVIAIGLSIGAVILVLRAIPLAQPSERAEAGR